MDVTRRRIFFFVLTRKEEKVTEKKCEIENIGTSTFFIGYQIKISLDKKFNGNNFSSC